MTARSVQPGYEALIAGTAAEYLVCADLLLSNYQAFRSDQAVPYDVAVDLGGRLVRVQVKATGKAKPYLQEAQRHIVGYSWHCRHGKGNSRAYTQDSFDVLALVALDIRRVAYLPQSGVRQTIQIPVSGMVRRTGFRTFEKLTFAAAVGDFEAIGCRAARPSFHLEDAQTALFAEAAE